MKIVNTIKKIQLICRLLWKYSGKLYIFHKMFCVLLSKPITNVGNVLSWYYLWEKRNYIKLSEALTTDANYGVNEWKSNH